MIIVGARRSHGPLSTKGRGIILTHRYATIRYGTVPYTESHSYRRQGVPRFVDKSDGEQPQSGQRITSTSALFSSAHRKEATTPITVYAHFQGDAVDLLCPLLQRVIYVILRSFAPHEIPRASDALYSSRVAPPRATLDTVNGTPLR